MQIYDFTVAANTQRQLDAPGTYFYYYSGNAGGADQTITLRGVSSGLRIVLKNGQSLRLPKGQAAETSWYIGNYANAATIVGTVIVGNGEIQDNRIQGSVETIDGEKARTLAGGMYSATPFVVTPAVGAISTAQLWNPVSSGKNIVVNQLSASIDTASGLTVSFGTVQAANDTTATRARNKLASGTIGVAKCGWGTAMAVTNVSYAVNLTALGSMLWNIRGAIVVQPGYGLNISSNQNNIGINSNFEWFEESIT